MIKQANARPVKVDKSKKDGPSTDILRCMRILYVYTPAPLHMSPLSIPPGYRTS